MKIGIFGGSFNPVHNEHIKIVKSAVLELGLDKLFVVPTFIAPHKKGEVVVDADKRFDMLKLAFNNLEKVEVLDYEIKKQGVSYSYQTIEHIKNLYKDSEVMFLMGSDMLENFPSWKNPEYILEMATLVLIERRDGKFNDSVLIQKIEEKYNKKVLKLNVYGEDLSSTKIRVYKQLGLTINEFVPIEVENYIDKNDIYKKDDYYNYVSSKLPEKRKIHTAGVIIYAIELAKKLGVDKKKAELAALLHDIAKYEDYNDYKDFLLDSSTPKDIVHQYLGEYIARTVLKIDDIEVLNAIKYHTTGRKGITLLEKIIYVADIIEPSRKFSGVEELRIAVNNDFDSGFKTCLKEIIEFLKLQNINVYPLTLEMGEEYGIN